MHHCTYCDAQSAKWSGRCDQCGKWGTLIEQEETVVPALKPLKNKAAAPTSARLFDLEQTRRPERLSTGDPEVDRVLGGGLVPGSLTLISGEPGIGKSTLVTSLAGNISQKDKPVLYISGEESAHQLAQRFSRLAASLEHINFLEPYPIESLISAIEKEKPGLAIIDSVQTLNSLEMDSPAGSPNLVRYATSLLLDLAKRTDIPILLIGQVTKDGSVAGPKMLEHLVDVVLSIEGDPQHLYRLLRASKNRFGSTDEVGVFAMTQNGLQAVANPSARFLEERVNVPGSVITALAEGSRVFLVEIQALVEKTAYGNPIRRASGFDQNRLQMLSAILSKHAGLKLGERDIYINVIGGLTVKEPAADLAVCAAILSAEKGVIGQAATVLVGEVGLGGEIRSVPYLERRLTEAQRFGLEHAIVPKHQKTPTKLEVKIVKTIKDLL
ncbi:DNA repair protein RadA [Patescibacteria group bacterium]|nr:DNA repair protein RadA [Patescibacteria group bacterium]MBU1705723.1 DNA repair protein RadA [Patescibacteria group bacterium]